MYRVLIHGMSGNKGGVESAIMNYFRSINKNKIHFDFIATSQLPYEREIKLAGSSIFYIPSKMKNPILYFSKVNDFMKKNAKKYDCIWDNQVTLANIDLLKLAKKYGIKRRIIHSHNSQNMYSGVKKIIIGFNHYKNKKVITKYATDFWACSEEAANWFYNSNIQDKTLIVHNAIDINKYKFSNNERNEVINKYNLENKYIIGNVGRLHFQKNQDFILDVLKEYIKHDKAVKVILVGEGPDRSKLIDKIGKLHLEEYVRLVGSQSDMQKWYSTFDLFLFPSRFEGLSVAALEAQANGVPILASNNVNADDIRMNSNFMFKDLNATPEEWVKEILKIKKNISRLEYSNIVKNFNENNYNIEETSKQLESIFLEKNF